MGSLKVEYLADGARVFNCTKHSCRSPGALPKTCKKIGGHRWRFFAKSAGKCFTPLTEIKHNSVSLRWNFYAYIQLIRWGDWLQLWTLKKFTEPRVSWENTLLICAKIQKCGLNFQRGFVDWRTDGAYLGGRPCVGRVHGVVYNASAASAVTHVTVTRLAKSRNGPKMVPCLLTSTDR